MKPPATLSEPPRAPAARFDFWSACGTLIAVGMLGPIPFMILAGSWGWDDRESVKGWVAIAWAWAPLSFYFGGKVRPRVAPAPPD